MRIILQNVRSNLAIFAAVIIMLVCLFISRALLSASVILFLSLTILHKNILLQLKKFLKTPLLISISLLIFIPLISGLWSEDHGEWINVVKIKLPFLFLPLAFAGDWKLSDKQWKDIAYIFISLILISCSWSFWQYFSDIKAINESYLKAKTIPTLLYNDHVRFSWLVCIAVMVNVYLIYASNKKKESLLLIIPLAFMVIYLHILAARTGLISLYFFFFCFFIFLLFQKKKYSIFLLITIAAAAWASWQFFPTLQNRFRYVRYDLSLAKDGITPGTSDANRLISLKAGWLILQHNPFGVGAGDVRNEANKWYDKNFPDITTTDKLYPSSEWMVYGDMAGWPAVLLFTFAIGFPLFVKMERHHFFWIMLIVVSIIVCLLETTLETQFGVFIYCFTILWWWKWFRLQNE